MPQTGPLHEGSTTEGIHTGQSRGAQEMGEGVLRDRTISGRVTFVRALMGQQSRRVSIQVVGRGTAVQIIKPLAVGWLPHSHGNYMVGKPHLPLEEKPREEGSIKRKCGQASKI